MGTEVDKGRTHYGWRVCGAVAQYGYCVQGTLTLHHRAPSQKFGRTHNDVMMTDPFFSTARVVDGVLGWVRPTFGGPIHFRMRLGFKAFKTPNVATHPQCRHSTTRSRL